MITVRSDAAAQAGRMRKAGGRVTEAAAAVTREFGVRGQQATRSNIRRSGLDLSGGAEIVDSVEVEHFIGRNYVGSRFGSHRDEAHRLEVGFVGLDSEGRHVDAPPFPAYRVTVADLGEQYTQAVTAAVRGAMSP